MYPSSCCQKCGDQIGWLGRFFQALGLPLHKCQPHRGPLHDMVVKLRAELNADRAAANDAIAQYKAGNITWEQCQDICVKHNYRYDPTLERLRCSL